MKATTVMLAAFGVTILGRWAHKKQTVTVQGVVQGVVAIIIVAVLDNGLTAPIAQGLAWLFLIAALLGSNSPLAALTSIGNKTK